MHDASNIKKGNSLPDAESDVLAMTRLKRTSSRSQGDAPELEGPGLLIE